MPDLTQDELTVLLIAAEGQSMAPIGRWEAPTNSLVAKGYLKSLDKFNNVITPAGLVACNKADDDNARALITANNAVVEGRQRAAARAQELAVLLVELATYSSGITGEGRLSSLVKWIEEIRKQALELLKK